MLPDLNEDGDLPVGVYLATLDEVLERFGRGSAARVNVGRRLDRIQALAQSTGQVHRFVIFGSFISGKPEPGDVDVFLLMSDHFDLAEVNGEPRTLFDHTVAQQRLGASIFWIRRLAALGGEQSAIEDWQIKRDGSRRGIVVVTGRS